MPHPDETGYVKQKSTRVLARRRSAAFGGQGVNEHAATFGPLGEKGFGWGLSRGDRDRKGATSSAGLARLEHERAEGVTEKQDKGWRIRRGGDRRND